MKKTISGVAVLALLASSAHAQIGSGTILLGGSIGYSSESHEGSLGYSNTEEELTKSSQFNVSPTLGYFVADNLAIGFNLGYSTGKNIQYKYNLSIPVSGSGNPTVTKTGEDEVKTRTFSVGPMARYYVFMGDKAAFFGQLGAGYESLRSESVFTSSNNPQQSFTGVATGSGYYTQLAPGFAFFPSDKFGLEVSLRGLTYQRLTTESNLESPRANPYPLKSTTSSFDAGLGLSSLQLGAAFYLGR